MVSMRYRLASRLLVQRCVAQLRLRSGIHGQLQPFVTPRAAIIQQRSITSSVNRLSPLANGGRSFEEVKEAIAQDIRSMQQPSELFIHMAYCLTLYAAVAIAIDAGLFRSLVALQSPHTAQDLTQGLGLASTDSQDALDREEFVTRVMRGLCGLKLVDEIGQSTYQANELTGVFADPGFTSGWMFMYNNLLGPQSTMTQALSWVKENGFKAPATAADGPFQRARDTVGTPSFIYYNQKDPKSMSQLSAWMQRIQRDRLNWSSWLPADVIFGAGGNAEDGIFMVDIGGGLGHDLNGFATRYPEREMRLVLQDQPSVIAEAKAGKLDPRIELAGHDFFTSQPIKGAKIVSGLWRFNFDMEEADFATLLSVLHAQDHPRLA